MKRLLAAVILLVPSVVFGATLSCTQNARGSLQVARTADGATTNTLYPGKRFAVGIQAYISAGTATASVQACCRDNLGTTGCDTDAEWGDLIGCSLAISAAGTRNLLCPISYPTSCRYRGFIATGTCLSSCSVDFTYGCTEF